MAKEFIVYSKTKAEFEALVSSGEVDTSQMGIIAETGEMWWDGEYRPIVETVPFAKDLTGRIEAAPEEFTLRPSAGDKSIRDDSALIKRIKGNTIVWNQQIKNPLEERTQTSVSSTYNRYRASKSVGEIIATHKYLLNVQIENDFSLISPVASNTRLFFYKSDIGESNTLAPPQLLQDGTHYLSLFFTVAKTMVDATLFFDTTYGSSVSDTSLIKAGILGKTTLIDLTHTFGVGNEPATIEGFKALLPNDYYDYNAGELVSMTSNGLFANGFNQWNEEWEVGVYKTYTASGDGSKADNSNYIRSADLIRVIPNTEYYVTSGSGSLRIGFYDSNRSYLGYDYVVYRKNGAFVTPERASYISFYLDKSGVTTYNKNICINISHSGVRNGEYEPYWGATKDLSIIQKYFPNGMRSAGSIYDEISFDETIQQWVAIQRVGSVDLGSLGWSLTGTNFLSDAFKAPSGAPPKSWTAKGNIVCAKYETESQDVVFNAIKDKSIATWGSAVRVTDSAYTDASSFKTAMSGVMLYYELAEPIITPIEEPVDLSYKVGDFGVEKMLSSSFSAPFKADIVYQFNATDRVRENSMNISRLSKEYALLNSKALTTDEQALTADQKAQVAANLGGNVTNGLARYVGGNLPLKKISAPDANGAEQTYVLPNASDEDKESADGVIATENFVNDGYVPRPSGTSTDKANKVLVFSDSRTYDSGVGIAQEVSDITEGATDSVPKSGHVKQYIESLVGERLSMSDSKIVVVVEDTYFDVNNAQKVALSTATKEILAKAKTLADNIIIRADDTAVVSAIKLSKGIIDVGGMAYALPTASDDTLAAADEVLATEDYVAEYMNANLPTAVATATERITTWPTTNSIRANAIYDISFATTTELMIYSFIGGSGTTYAFDDVWRVRFAGLSSALSVIPTVRWENGVAPNYTEWAICDLEFRRLPNDEYIGKWTIYK